MREWDLFPDFEGFARANGQDKPFSREYGSYTRRTVFGLINQVLSACRMKSVISRPSDGLVAPKM